jgi:phenylalanyl-tRNA synthetase alpha chain
LYSTEDLVDVLAAIAKSVYGNNIRWRVEEDTFPFTSPSIELQIWWNNRWLEVLGAGIVHGEVLKNLGVDPREYNGWAFGFGLDRLAMIKMDIPDIRILWSTDERIQNQFNNIDSKFSEVSKYPPIDRDISFLVKKDISLNLIYELMRDCGFCENEDLIEEVKIIDTYSDDTKFGSDIISYTFRIRYRSHVRSLKNEEINSIQENLRIKVKNELNATLR